MTRRRQKQRRPKDKQDNLIKQTPKPTFRKQKVEARTKNQRTFIKSIKANKLTVCLGPAGTGKTYLPTALAMIALRSGDVKRIIITRPVVEAGERLGFLPGDMQAKLDPYFRSIYDEMLQFVDQATLDAWFLDKTIEICPFAFMRGRNLHGSFIIADEAQNATRKQLIMLVTRFGKSSKMIISGDHTQVDLRPESQSGLAWLADEIVPRMRDDYGSDADIVTMDNADIVREGLVEDFINAVEEYDEDRASEDTSFK